MISSESEHNESANAPDSELSFNYGQESQEIKF